MGTEVGTEVGTEGGEEEGGGGGTLLCLAERKDTEDAPCRGDGSVVGVLDMLGMVRDPDPPPQTGPASPPMAAVEEPPWITGGACGGGWGTEPCPLPSPAEAPAAAAACACAAAAAIAMAAAAAATPGDCAWCMWGEPMGMV